MKVCVISSIFPPFSRGGAETAAYASAQAFTQAGHDVFLITCAPFEGWRSFAGAWSRVVQTIPPLNSPLQGGEKNRRIAPLARGGIRGGGSTIRVFRFTPLNLFSIFSISKHRGLLRLFWHIIDMVNPHTYLVVRRILLQEKPDLILTHNLKGLGYSVHLAIHHSRYVKQFTRQHAKWLHTIHDMGALHPTGLRVWGREHTLFQRNPLVALYAWVNKKLLGDPDVVISPSKFLLDEYHARGFFPKSKTAIVRNPVTPPISPSSQGGKRRGAREEQFRFLYIGQLEPYKGLRLLLKVWQEFSGAHKGTELVIAGEGSMKEEVENAAQRLARVRYVGFVRQEELGKLFVGSSLRDDNRKSVLVLPSLAYENSPTSIGEAFVHGVPVVASRIGGIPEIVEDGKNGLLFEPGNVRELRGAMENVMKEWEKLSAGACNSAEEFSIEKYREQIEFLIHLISLVSH